jgi:hypothetical protein
MQALDRWASRFDLRDHAIGCVLKIVDAGRFAAPDSAVALECDDDSIQIDERVIGDTEGRLQRPLLDGYVQFLCAHARHASTSRSNSAPPRIGSATGMRQRRAMFCQHDFGLRFAQRRGVQGDACASHVRVRTSREPQVEIDGFGE